jgi:DNA-binding CsgD family transcriptional regulator
MMFNDADVGALLRICGEVGELTQDTWIRRAHILNRLLKLFGGCWAVCSEMDPRFVGGSGWAFPNSITHAGELSSYQQRLIDEYLTGRLDALDPCVPHLLREPMPVATFRREDVVDRSWFRSDHYNCIRRPLGFGESMYAKLVTPQGRYLKLSIHRELHDSPFTERHAQLLHIFNQNLSNLYDPAPRREPLPAPLVLPDPRVNSLPPRLRPVLQRILAGDAEKQAALKLGLSPHTIHEYTKALYRAFGVSSRGELMAQFVSGPSA